MTITLLLLLALLLDQLKNLPPLQTHWGGGGGVLQLISSGKEIVQLISVAQDLAKPSPNTEI